MARHKGFERTSEANLTNLIGNLSVPVPFFEFKGFNNFSTSSEVTKILREKSLSEQNLELFVFILPIKFRELAGLAKLILN